MALRALLSTTFEQYPFAGFRFAFWGEYWCPFGYNGIMQHGKERDHFPELTLEWLKAYATAFLNRDDCYPRQLDKGSYVTITKPLPPDLIVAHLKGLVTLGAYALDTKSQAKWLCLDADSAEEFESLVQLARQLEHDHIPGYLELSRRGGHLWLFTPPTSGGNIRQFGKQLIHHFNLPQTLELYPKQDQLVSGPGSLVRLPLGIHRKTGRRYHFITPKGDPLAPTIREQLAVLSQPARVPQDYIDGLLAQAPEAPNHSPTRTFTKRSAVTGETLSETLKGSINVLEFVSQFVALDEQGRGHCPFHEDQHQSFQVNVQGNYWHCYAGCGGGSIIDFFMKWRDHQGEDGSFTATIKTLREMLL